MASNILITGAAGFVGQQLAAAFLERQPGHRLVLTDIIKPAIPQNLHGVVDGTSTTPLVSTIQADLRDSTSLKSLLDAAAPLAAVYILHGIMSSGSEAAPALSYDVNFDATRSLLFALASTQRGTRIFYASSQAVYGPPLPAIVDDSVTATPASVYGTHKLMCETLINDLHKRGEITGFCLRFPTVSVRAGKPTAAASSFLSGMIREPMSGQRSIIPMQDRQYRAVLCSPQTLVDNLMRMLDVRSDALPEHIRWLNFPGISVSVQDMLDALVKVGGKERLDLISEKSDPAVERILKGWPRAVDDSKAKSLGLLRDVDAEELVRRYIETLSH